ncbi:MAG: hypothetical protein WBV70_03550 [Candidatus Bathyarchaeia archaeon]
MNFEFINLFCPIERNQILEDLSMGLLSAVSKTILVYTCAIWIFAIVSLLVMGQTFLAVITTATFMIPLYMVISEYLKLKNKQKL